MTDVADHSRLTSPKEHDMSRTHLRPRLGTRIVSATLLSATLLAGPALGGVSSVQAAGPAQRDAPTCQQVWDAMPDALRDDIAAAVALDQPQQRRALRGIRYAALRGSYGETVQTRARQLRERRVALWESFPAALKADVRAARSLPVREQRRAVYAIRRAALQGGYGDRVQRLAEERRTWLEGCPSAARTFESNDDLGVG